MGRRGRSGDGMGHMSTGDHWEGATIVMVRPNRWKVRANGRVWQVW